MTTHHQTLEFHTILSQLAELALSKAVKARCFALVPADTLEEAIRLNHQTSEAKKIMEQVGTPPLAEMTDLDKVLALLAADAMLTIEHIEQTLTFLSTCNRMKRYLVKAQETRADIAFYGESMVDLSEMEAEINRCIIHGQIEDRATTRLYDIRRSITLKGEQIKNKIEALLKTNKQYCVDGFVAVRNGRYTMPVQKKYKNKIPGTLVDVSNTGGTCFIEPTAVSRLTDELSELHIEEDNEVRTILYTLTALIDEQLPAIRLNIEAMETLDFVFAKAKLSLAMKGVQIRLTQTREIRLLSAIHPLLGQGQGEEQTAPVPLNFALGGDRTGIIITGPNTGGKTVAIKTVGLFSLMAQSGLHVPVDPQSSLCFFDGVWCDIGDGQSISQNLSTFSSHMTNIIDVLGKITDKSLVLFDELGSGTDPAEGMGIATAILEELLTKGCLFTVTTHYPEIKEFAAQTKGVINARMAFDRESLLPLYRLEIGEAGESSALYIAQRLGMPPHLLERAKVVTYGGGAVKRQGETTREIQEIEQVTPLAQEEKEEKPQPALAGEGFQIGDSVSVLPEKSVGIVYQRVNGKGEIGVQIKGEKRLVNHKRLKLRVSADELYPEDYDFSIIFDTVENRKAKHLMGRKHVPGTKREL